MNINLVVDDDLIEEARGLGKHQTQQDVIIEALEEYIQYWKQLQVLNLFGTIDYDEDYDYKEQRRRV